MITFTDYDVTSLIHTNEKLTEISTNALRSCQRDHLQLYFIRSTICVCFFAGTQQLELPKEISETKSFLYNYRIK